MEQKSNKAVSTGLISAFAASLCCITPIIAMAGGITGISSTFSWMEPLRPYLIALTVGALGYAWYKHIQVSRQEIDCECDDEEEQEGVKAIGSFMNTRGFLVGVTVVSVLLMGVPYYSGMLLSDDEPNIVYVNTNNIKEIEYKIEGMTCSACEIHVNKSAKKINGVISANSDYNSGVAHIKYDESKANKEDIKSSIQIETGYKVVKEKNVIQE